MLKLHLHTMVCSLSWRKKSAVVALLALSCMSSKGHEMAYTKDIKKYRSRRDFAHTPEPRGTAKKVTSKKPIFVIHKHDASHLHYDLRLEVGGVLPSWAVPKGPSLDPRQKRLAMQTEDHPYEYAQFEGVIPEGNYGAGTVMIWDYGTYDNIKRIAGKLVPMKQCLKDGRIEIELHGQKLHGGFALIRTGQGGDDRKWLLIKMRDDMASARRNPVSSQTKSALTGRTMREIARDEGPESDTKTVHRTRRRKSA